MKANDDQQNFDHWMRTWQDDQPRSASTERIREYVTRRGRLMRAFRATDVIIGAIALPLLIYLAWNADNTVSRLSMIGLASITVAAVAFGWWNWGSVGRSSATTTAEFVALSVERNRRMRLACGVGWAILAAQVATFSMWIWSSLYTGPGPVDAGAERFAWSWLAGFAILAAFWLLWFGRWLRQDTARFSDLRHELDIDTPN